MSVYGCHNRAPHVTMVPAQDGWFMDGVTRAPRMVPVAVVGSRECQYRHTDLGQRDERCNGCRWRS